VTERTVERQPLRATGAVRYPGDEAAADLSSVA
jgi:hypothetical protein